MKKGGVDNQRGMNYPNPTAMKSRKMQEPKNGPLNPKARLFMAKSKTPKMSGRRKV